jgi:hypothetical protein
VNRFGVFARQGVGCSRRDELRSLAITGPFRHPPLSALIGVHLMESPPAPGRAKPPNHRPPIHYRLFHSQLFFIANKTTYQYRLLACVTLQPGKKCPPNVKSPQTASMVPVPCAPKKEKSVFSKRTQFRRRTLTTTSEENNGDAPCSPVLPVTIRHFPMPYLIRESSNQ